MKQLLPPPADISTKDGGAIFWRSLSLPANETTRLEYRAKVRGLEYFTYCNVADGILPDGLSGFLVNNREGIECVKINPQIEMIKTSNKESALPGEEIRFSLRLQNNSGVTQTVAIADVFQPDEFEFLRVDPDQTYGKPPRTDTLKDGRTVLLWDQVQLRPNDRLEAAFFARIPPRQLQSRTGCLYQSAVDAVPLDHQPDYAALSCGACSRYRLKGADQVPTSNARIYAACPPTEPFVGHDVPLPAGN